MKNNTVLSLSLVAVAAAFEVAGIQGAVGASMVAGLVLIFMADYASGAKVLPVDAKELSAAGIHDHPSLCAGPARGSKAPGAGRGAWSAQGSLQRRLVDGPVY